MRKLIVWCICLVFARLFCAQATGTVQEIKRDIWYNISEETRRTFLCYTPYKEAIKKIEQTFATLKPETLGTVSAEGGESIQFH